MKREKEWGIFSQEEKDLTDNRRNNVLRSTYEPPKTCLFKVETEGNFCGSVINDDKESSDVETTNQQVQNDYYENGKNPFDFSNDSWD